MLQVIVVGAGGFGREVMQYLLDASQATGAGFQAKGFLDDEPQSLENAYLGLGLLGDTYTYQLEDNDRFLVAIGDPAIQRAVAARLAERGARFFTFCHPLAYVAQTALVDEGGILCPFAFVGPGARLEKHVILNIYASVGHDAHLEAHCVLSPYATVNGNVYLGKEVFMGTHSTVIRSKKVGERSKLAAGAVAMNDIPPRHLVAGNPARGRELYR